MTERTVRLNSLLKEVISEAIHRDLQHVPHINEFVTITSCDITKDLSFAKVYVSVLGDEKEKKKAVAALQEKAGLIARICSKKVRMRFFPNLSFELDLGLEQQLHMEELLSKISKERKSRDEQKEPLPPSEHE